MDFMNEEEFRLLYGNIHDSFLYFTDKYSLSLLQAGQCVLTLCFGFRDPESIEVAKKFIENDGHDMHLLRRAFVETWLINLNTLELVQGTGLLRKAGQTVSETADEVLKKNKILSSNGANLSPDALTRPFSFIQHIKSFNTEIENGTSTLPEEWLERFRPECVNLKIRACKKQIQRIEARIEEYERQIGEELLSKYKEGFSFNDLDRDLKIALDRQDTLDGIEENIDSIRKLRFRWKESQKIVREIQESSGKLGEQYRGSCYQLTKTLFEQETETIRADPHLGRVFAKVFITQAEISKRNEEISRLHSEKAGFFHKMKAETRVMYLKGVNQVSDWKKDNRWVEIGEEVVNSPSAARSLSSVKPIFKVIEDLKADKEILDIRNSREMELQIWIKEKIKSIADSNEYAYPWLELEEKLIRRAGVIRQECSALFLSLGKTFPMTLQETPLMTSREVPGFKLQGLCAEIKFSESQILEFKKEVEKLRTELLKIIP
ncbi:hypothetical protein [Methanosarcina sp. MSH10X1]|uniref:hypothetical protein n=1 Tax=Methanosarcina sp. MSH10X1 TaxID=2507075 RepID=UPI0013E33FA7|nr:hypothetical protein [Methanosarcina sp. MSH10X1]